MPERTDGELECPQCGHKNPAKADYCWECRFDFIHDDRLREAARTAPPPPPPRARPIPPPYSTRPAAAKPDKTGEPGSGYTFLFELVISTIIVGGTFALYTFALRGAPVIFFVIGWVIALILVRVSEGVLPDPETDVNQYWSMNPFQYRDDMNRKVLAAHIWLFLPRIVLHTIRRAFSVVFAAK